MSVSVTDTANRVILTLRVSVTGLSFEFGPEGAKCVVEQGDIEARRDLAPARNPRIGPDQLLLLKFGMTHLRKPLPHSSKEKSGSGA